MIVCDEAEQDEAIVLGRLAPEEARELERELERFRGDVEYYDAHRAELIAAYPEQWVAIYGKQVVAVAHEHGALLEKLDACGIPRRSAYRAYVTADDVDLFL